MRLAYLIDGYNLLYASGILSGRVGPQGLEKARLSLLGMLAESFGKDASQVTVVFDASKAPPGAKPDAHYQGLKVRYAVGKDQADDEIESILRHHSAPKQLVVVSDDRRIQNAASRRRARVSPCEEFLNLLDRLRRPQSTRDSDPGKKPDVPKETEHWLKEFGDLK